MPDHPAIAEPLFISDLAETKFASGYVSSIVNGAAKTKMPDRICANWAKDLLTAAEMRLRTSAAATSYGAITP